MHQTIEYTTELLHKKQVSHFEITAHTSVGTSLSVRMGELENSVRYQNQALEINVVCEGKSGSCSTVDISKKGIGFAVENAISLATFSEADEYNTLAPPELLATGSVDLDLYHPYALSAEEALKVAKECEKAALDQEHITNSDGAEVASFSGTSYYANSYGILLEHPSSSHSLNCAVIASDKGDMQTAYEYDNALVWQELSLASEIGKSAAEKANNKLNPQVIASGEYPVIFANTISSSLISSMLAALSGRAQYKKSSFLLDSIDTAILPEGVDIIEKPLAPRTIGARFFDTDGVQKRQQFFVQDGRVQSYILSQYSANKLGLNTTANAGGTSNVWVQSRFTPSVGEMIASMDKGIIIDELMGQGVNLITGDYSRGASGFMIENGIITYPVAGITIASNLRDMLANISIATDVDMRKNIKVGAVRIESMTVAGN